MTLGAGLASRRYPALIPEWIARYAGDTLWAALVFWLLALVWRRSGTMRVGAGAIAIALAVEVSQRYHAPWIDAIRETALGSLILGSGFLWSDLVCYAIGIGGAAAVDLCASPARWYFGPGVQGASRPRTGLSPPE